MVLDENDTILYEIVELKNGEVALAKVDGDHDALVTIRFSREALFFLEGKKIKVAKAMIEAGLNAVSEFDDSLEDVDEIDDEEDSDLPPTLH